jgi:hypothetical protein
MRAIRLCMVVAGLALLAQLLATPAQAFSLAEVAQRFAKSGEKPHPGGPQRPPGPVSGPIGGPIGGPGPGPGPRPAPDVPPQQQAMITELMVILVGHAANDLSRGAELYSADGSEKNLNFLRYTVNKVITALELDPRDGTLAPVARAVETGDAAAITQAVAAMDGELRDGIGNELGPEYLWYYEAGQNVSRLEFAIWEASGFNMLHYFGKSTSPQVSFASPMAASAGDMATLLGQLAARNGQSTDVVELVKEMIALRTEIENRYGFPGNGMVLW